MDSFSEFSRVKKYENFRKQIKNKTPIHSNDWSLEESNFENTELLKPLLVYKNSKHKNDLIKNIQLLQKEISEAIISSQMIIDELDSSIKELNPDSLITSYKDMLKNKHFLNPDLYNATSFYEAILKNNSETDNRINEACDETFKKLKKYNIACLFHLKNKKYSYLLACFYKNYLFEKNNWLHFCKQQQKNINPVTKKIIDELITDLDSNFSKLNKVFLYFYKHWKLCITLLPFISVIIFQKFGWNFKNNNVK